MNKLLCVIIGSLIAIMVGINGSLFNYTDLYSSLLIIHIVGLLFSFIALVISKEKSIKKSSIPLIMYCGGLIGVVIVAGNNYCFSFLGMSLTTALTLLGQTFTSTIIDSFGLLDMKKIKFNKAKIPGFLTVILGIIAMLVLDSSSKNTLSTNMPLTIIMIIFAFVVGGCVVLSMVINSQLGTKIGVMRSTFLNYLTGFTAILILFLITNGKSTSIMSKLPNIPIWAYLGGVLGVSIIILSNIVVHKIPAVYSTLLILVGQLVASLVIDYFIQGTFCMGKLLGALLIAIGMSYNMYVDYKSKAI